MRVSVYSTAEAFLHKVETYLEHEEVVNNLILGVCFRLQQTPPKTMPFLATVEDDQGLALAAMMTPPHRLVLYSHLNDPTQAVQGLIQQLQQTNWTIPGAQGPVNVAEVFARRWGRPHTRSMGQRVFELREVVHPVYPLGLFRMAEPADLDVVAQWVLEFTVEIGEEATLEESRALAQERIAQGTIFLWDHDQPVSMAAKVRPIRRGCAISLVYTPPVYRRRGYAAACVARLSQQLLDSGYEYCSLFTDLANPTSNHIYQEIGYIPVCDFIVYDFALEGESKESI